MLRRYSSRLRLYPAAVWLIVLLVIFVTEYAVMLLLPRVLPVKYPRVVEAAVDSVMLTAVVAPIVWWTVVRPLREVNHLRTQFLTNLFDRIEADRKHAAHELHDGVGQSLSLLVSGLRSAHASLRDPEMAGRCERLLKLAQESLNEVKRLALGMRPSLLDDLGLAPALERLVSDVRTHHPIEIEMDVEAIGDIRLSEPAESAIFRIVQEALSNIVVHSKGTFASVSVSTKNGTVIVTIEDNGCGFEPPPINGSAPGHLGLVGMRERAELLGGTFEVRSEPGRGTRIQATIPVGA